MSEVRDWAPTHGVQRAHARSPGARRPRAHAAAGVVHSAAMPPARTHARRTPMPAPTPHCRGAPLAAHPKRPTPTALKIGCGAHAPRPQVDFVAYKLGKRLDNPHWVVALKALMVYHRLMRECDPSFQEQVRERSHARAQCQGGGDACCGGAAVAAAWPRPLDLHAACRAAPHGAAHAAPPSGGTRCADNPPTAPPAAPRATPPRSSCASATAAAASACCAWTGTRTTPAGRRGTTVRGSARMACSWTSASTPSGAGRDW